jgi:tight adherence protein C
MSAVGLVFAALAAATLLLVVYGIYLALKEVEVGEWIARRARRVTLADLGTSFMTWAGKRQQEWPPLARLASKIHEQVPKWLGASDPGASIWLVRKEIYLVAGFVAGFTLLGSPLIGIVAGFGAAVLPDMVARERYLARQERLERELPDVLDLLSLSLEAGLSVDTGLAQVADKYRGGLMADAIARMLGEIRFGARRHDAWRSMADGLGNLHISEVIGAMIQADSMGVGLVQSLKGLAVQTRVMRRQQIEEMAQKAPVKMLFPMVLFIFPAIFIVLLGPILLQLTEVFR